jgi:ketosteroid isomerase-like protein
MKTIVLFGLVMATPAMAEKTAAAIAAATAVIDKTDAAYNAKDAEAMVALLDPSFIAEGPRLSNQVEDFETHKKSLAERLPKAGRITRDAITLRADESGDVVWYIADYTVIMPAAPGQMPMQRKLRESGVVIKRGKGAKAQWKIGMWHASLPQPDPASSASPH